MKKTNKIMDVNAIFVTLDFIFIVFLTFLVS